MLHIFPYAVPRQQNNGAMLLLAPPYHSNDYAQLLHSMLQSVIVSYRIVATSAQYDDLGVTMHVRGLHTITREAYGEDFTITVHDDLHGTTDHGYLATATIAFNDQYPSIMSYTDVAEKLFKDVTDIRALTPAVTGTISLSIKEATEIIQIEASIVEKLA